MIVAVTGGTGFVGKHLVEKLVAEGHHVRVLSKTPANDAGDVLCFVGDLSAKEGLNAFVKGVDVLIHCASEIRDESRMYATNVAGTRNLLEAACNNVKHVVLLSTVDVYGSQPEGIVTEAAPFAPMNLYEETKVAAENILTELAEQGGYSWTILRPSKIYATDMRNPLLFKLISLIDKRLFFFVGKPGASANYVHVHDVVDALIRCGTLPTAKNKAYNLSDYRTLEDFTTIIARNLQRKPPRLRLPETMARFAAWVATFIPFIPLTQQRVTAMMKRSVYSTQKLRAELEYKTIVSMEVGLRDLVAAWRQRSLSE